MTAVKKIDQSQSFNSHSTFNNVPNSVFPEQKWLLLDALSYLEKLQDNWNGVDAKKPTAQSIFMAKHFVKFLLLTKAHADFVRPDADGGLILEWKREDTRTLLTIDGAALHLSYENNGSTPIFVDDIPFFSIDNNILPAKILNYVPNCLLNA
ncbi:MAG: hypothetical protein KAJ40_04385 [Alphaproteobacteria bacterium]|nr:hypothetical protein [Alphaproteobacteria bacterium]